MRVYWMLFVFIIKHSFKIKQKKMECLHYDICSESRTGCKCSGFKPVFESFESITKEVKKAQEKPMLCPHCNEQFTKISTCLRHIEKNHSIQWQRQGK